MISSSVSTVDDRPAIGSGFWTYWSSSTISSFGDSLRSAALPLLAATMTHNPLLLSLVTVISFLPWLVVGSWAGIVGDMFDPKTVMLVLNLARFVLTAGFCVLLIAGYVNIALICALSAVLTTVQIVFSGAATSILPSLLDQAGLARGNGRLESGRSVLGGFVGAPVGAFLFGVGHTLPLAIDSVTFLVSALLLVGVRPVRTAAVERKRAQLMISEGIRFLAEEKTLPVIAGLLAAVNFVTTSISAVLVLYVIKALGAPNVVYGILTGSLALGAFVAGFIARTILRRLQVRTVVALAVAVRVTALVVAALAHDPVTASVAFFVQGLSMTVWNVTSTTLIQQTVPKDMLSRAGTLVKTIAISTAPLGALAGGILAESVGLRAPMWVGAVILCAAGIGATVRLSQLHVKLNA